MFVELDVTSSIGLELGDLSEDMRTKWTQPFKLKYLVHITGLPF
jgi:hypothetical protein